MGKDLEYITIHSPAPESDFDPETVTSYTDFRQLNDSERHKWISYNLKKRAQENKPIRDRDLRNLDLKSYAALIGGIGSGLGFSMLGNHMGDEHTALFGFFAPIGLALAYTHSNNRKQWAMHCVSLAFYDTARKRWFSD
jgi:hypothetical protein